MGNKIYDEDRIIAFLDILGFSEKVKESIRRYIPLY